MKAISKGVGKKTTGKASKGIYPQEGDDWQAESDFSTLTRAHEVTSDPKRHKAAIAHGKKKLAKAQAAVDHASKRK